MMDPYAMYGLEMACMLVLFGGQLLQVASVGLHFFAASGWPLFTAAALVVGIADLIVSFAVLTCRSRARWT
jgi:hypothetical protein